MKENNCVSNRKPCSGCGVCIALCPKDALSMVLNSEGFYEVFLNEDKCISCGICVKVCPKYEDREAAPDFLKEYPLYAVWSTKKEDSYISSSGGVAAHLTELALKNGYKAAGVIYDYCENRAKAVIAETLEEAKAYRGSKYLQAYTAECYKEMLNSQNKFIVFGTPCQIAGLDLASKLKNKRDNFLLVDCLCHGVPSYLLWHSFLEYINIPNPKEVSFRKKAGGWHNFCMEVAGPEGKYYASLNKNPFYQLFFSDLLLNESCYTCSVKSLTYCDMRIGDFWGSPYDIREDGVNAVFVFSERGDKIFKELLSSGKVNFEKGDKKVCFRTQSAFRKTSGNKAKRKELIRSLKNKNYDDVFKFRHISRKKKLFIFLKQFVPGSLAKYIRFVFHKIGEFFYDLN